ncbi:MAG: sulfatase-like hydrolase/transferase [Gemmataceae bacterium]
MKLLLLIPRGLQAALIGPYGNRWTDTPNFDLLAEAGTVFDRHLSARPGTAPLDDALLDALRAAGVRTRLLRDASRGVLPGSPDAEGHDGTERTLAAAKKALRSIDGLLAVEFASLLPPWRVAAQFLDAVFAPPPAEEEEDEGEDDEEEEEEESSDEEEAGLELLPEEEPLEPVLAPAAGPIDVNDDKLFLSIQSTYAAAIAQFDAVMGELLDGLPDDVTLLVTSDAGLPLGEHGHVGPGGGLFEELVHVPLLAVGPGVRAGARVADLTSTLDLAATVAGHFGVALPGVDLLKPSPPRESVVLEAGGERAVRTAAWYLRLPDGGAAALYEKPHDRGDLLDVSGAHFGVTEELVRRLGEKG